MKYFAHKLTGESHHAKDLFLFLKTEHTALDSVISMNRSMANDVGFNNHLGFGYSVRMLQETQ